MLNKYFKVLALSVLFPALVLAQPVTNAKRNDSFATTLQGTNLGNMPFGADAQGRAGAYPYVIGRTANPTPVAIGTPIALDADKVGRIIQIPQQMRELVVRTGVITLSASTAETTFLAAGAAGIFHDLSSMWCNNTSATAVRIDVRDATAGTVIFPINVPAGDIRGIAFPVPNPQAAAANNWTIQSSASVTDVRCSGVFVKNL